MLPDYNELRHKFRFCGQAEIARFLSDAWQAAQVTYEERGLSVPDTPGLDASQPAPEDEPSAPEDEPPAPEAPATAPKPRKSKKLSDH